MFQTIKDIFHDWFHNRLAVITTFLVVCFSILFGRVFYLQIIKGQEYLDSYTVSILKEKTISATRGSIYDRNGNLLAYDRLSYSVTFQDTDEYDNTGMNNALYRIIEIVESNDDSISETLSIEKNDEGQLAFTVSGSSLQRFLADVYGHTYITELEYNKKLGYDEAEATPQQVFDYLCDNYNIYTEHTEDRSDMTDEDRLFTEDEALKLLNARYAVSVNAYQKYIDAVIAEDVSDETVAMIQEYSDQLIGVDVAESTVRIYEDSEYFAQILGYTGVISEEEYQTLSKERDDYILSDKVGKSGIEQYMETTLQGTKGREEVFVNNVGTVLEVSDHVDPVAGNDVYLTLDADLQKACYELLEQELAAIIVAKMQDIDSLDEESIVDTSNIIIPSGDVYFALIDNNVVDLTQFSDDDAGENEQEIYAAYERVSADVQTQIQGELYSSAPTAFNDCAETMQDYQNYLMQELYSDEIIDQESVDTESDEYNAWKEGTGSLKAYLEYNIASDNVDTSLLTLGDEYVDSGEVYDAIVSYLNEIMITDPGFQKLIYRSMLTDGYINGKQICMTLYEQGVLEQDGYYESLSSGSLSAFSFMYTKISNLEITPAQLALDPCNASTVIVDPNDGEVLACVTYPGYDNNKLANSVDRDYYASLTTDLSYPLLNYATQQNTAPGSTYKMLTSVAALTDGYLAVDEMITDLGEFTYITPSPKCWIFSSGMMTHGTINVTSALRDSCNYFYYELGYRMGSSSGVFSDNAGLKVLTKYAEEFGLGDASGIEIQEATPNISDMDVVRSAIGQGTNSYPTTSLAKYTAAVANGGTVYDLSLIYKTTDHSGNVIEQFEPTVYNELTDVSDETWDAVHEGMRQVVESLDSFDTLGITVAGKTGTAQESSVRPPHALFVGYAPFDSPEIAVATRIPYGYASSNAAEITRYIMDYYFGLTTFEEITGNIKENGGEGAGGD